MEIKSDFFEQSTNENSNNIPILLIDASGSVLSKYNDSLSIFDKTEEIVKSIKSDQFRIIFWNSDIYTNKEFTNGVFVIPYLVKKETIKQCFTIVKNKINNTCLTFPHLGFKNIPEKWIDNVNATHIYYITDGQIGYGECSLDKLKTLKNEFKKEIERIFKNFNNVHLHIITIESKNIDLNESENLNIIAGGDIFQIIQENELTKYITEFISFTKNNEEGYKHINNIIVPKGYIPFGDKYFSETKMNLFIKYLHDHISKTSDENDLLKIVQYLSNTISYLIKDKSSQQINNIIKTFCQMFVKTSLDMSLINFMLHDCIKSQIQGKALVFSEYRTKLKNLYKEAQNLLLIDAKNAIGLQSYFITLPLDNKIIFGNDSLIQFPIKLFSNVYPKSSIKLNSHILPVLPSDLQNISKMNEQCLRQYIRSIVAKQYNTDIYSDLIIYIILALTLQVVLSDVDDKIKTTFRNLSTVMLNKKRLNSDNTEFERIESGELPIPNGGKIEDFYGFMNKVKSILQVECQPLTMWYALCLALNNKTIIVKQLIHCKESINKDFSDVNPNEILSKFKITKINLCEIPIESSLDYKCIITIEEVDAIGGFKFKSHDTISGHKCCPIYVLSESGFNSLIEQENCFCPICYTNLTKNDFEKVGPKKLFSDEFFNKEFKNPFEKIKIEEKISVKIEDKSKITSNKNKFLILLKGTVGSGKTTFSSALQKTLEEKKYLCINEGTDKYCKTGMDIKTSIEKVSSILKNINNIDSDKIVVIIDACNENCNVKNIFGVDFSEWKNYKLSVNYDYTNIKGYLAWSLRNVLLRTKVNENSTYWLNPDETSCSVCVNVHFRKARVLFGKKKVKIVSNSTLKNDILNDIKSDADAYEKYLENNLTTEKQMNELIKYLNL